MSGLFNELRRRNVFRVAAAYIVTAWLIAQVAELALDAFQAPPWALKFLLLILVLGLPVALAFAWVYELTPEGIRREAEVDRSESVTPVTGRRLDRVIIVVLLLIIAVMGLERLWLGDPAPAPAGVADRPAPTREASPASSEPSGPDKSIAVLSFADLSQTQDQRWFADGLAEEILNALTRTPDLMVASRTSSFAYGDSGKTIRQIADELGVAHVLEGSVRRGEDRIRVAVQLTRAADGFNVWSEIYDREVQSLMDIQAEIARRIATALKTTMDPEALADMTRAGTRSVEAYQAYLTGLGMVGRSGRELTLADAYPYFERAREIDTGFSWAHHMAALFWQIQMIVQRRDSGFAEDVPAREKLRRFSERIQMAIDTATSDAARAGYEARRAWVDLRLGDTVGHFQRYLQERPGDLEAWHALGTITSTWTLQRAIAADVVAHLKSLALSSPEAAFNYANLAYRVEDPDEVAGTLDELIERWPDKWGFLFQAHRALLWLGRGEQATRLGRRLFDDGSLAPASEGDRTAIIGQARQLCHEGKRAEVESLLAAEQDSSNASLATRWHLLMLLGRVDDANETVRRVAQQGVPYQIAGWLYYPHFDPRAFPSLVRVLEREGIDRPLPVEIPFACPPPDNTIAVLPFVNMSGDADREYFSDGMTEEIINTLVRVPGLDVAARTSVFAFKGRQADVRAIGRELGVGYVLEGSVRSDGENLRITAQLIKVDDGFHLWSETYDRKLENVFAVQEDIAESIAGVLTDTLKLDATTSSARTEDLDAYDAYLQGRGLLRSRQDLERALVLFGQATRADPGFAPAWAAMAIAADVVNNHEDAERYALKALELDPDNVDALNALGGAYRDTWRWEDAEAAFDRALAIDPSSSELLEDYAEFLASVGRSREQVEAEGQQDRAREVLGEILAVSSLAWLQGTAIDAELSTGDVEAAVRRAGRMDVPPTIREAFVRLVRDPSDDAAARVLKASLKDEPPAGVQGPDLGAMLASAALLHGGEGKFMLELIKSNPESMHTGLPEQFFTPMYASVRQADGFADLLDLIGLPDYWDATAWPEACARAADGDVRCR
ncbi:MAG: hypothetical protein P8102_03955 [Gammaproteobacteria bacterium]